MDILNLPEHIRILEELLLHQDFSNNPNQLEAMISNDFREIDARGREVTREEVVSWLLGKSPDSRWEFLAYDVRQLAPGLVLSTYQARQIQPKGTSGGRTMHSSLWQEKHPGQTWELLFHQSTRLADSA
jgi:hypothetical protein